MRGYEEEPVGLLKIEIILFLAWVLKNSNTC
jgi:hypothetical protein